jgi:predicted PurR-regulated permease PerM
MSTRTQPNWFFIGLVTVVVALVFFLPFLAVICLAAVLASLFTPVYRLFLKKLSPRIAATSTMILSIAIVVIPATILVVMSIAQGLGFAKTLADLGVQTGAPLHVVGHPVVDSINALLSPLTGGQPVVSYTDIQAVIKQIIPAVIQTMTDIVINFASNIPTIMTSIILYGFLFNTFLIYGASIRKIFETLSPFEHESSSLYIDRASTIITASLRTQFFIAFITAVLSALLLIPLGLSGYFFFFVFVFTLLGMVPLGSGILMVPICIIAMFINQFWIAFWVLAIYLGVVCNIDSFLRVKLIPKNAKLLPAITTLSTFCGIAYFGILGVIYGPLIAILLTTTFDVYMSHRKQTLALATQGG